MKTNMYIELPPIVKDRFKNEAQEAFKAISLKVMKNKEETFKGNFIESYMSLKSQNYFNVERSLETQSQLIQGFEERENELLEQIEQLKKQIRK